MSKKNTVAQIEDTTVAQIAQIEPEIKQADPVLSDLMSEFKSKSSVIRHLAVQGWTRGRIAKFMNIRYQHVRNVLVTPLKKVEPATEQTK